jgi:hypothetical protein
VFLYCLGDRCSKTVEKKTFLSLSILFNFFFKLFFLLKKKFSKIFVVLHKTLKKKSSTELFFGGNEKEGQAGMKNSLRQN